MAKKTCLELVSEILSAIGSDEVTAIDDTTEARQAFAQLKIAYDELVSSRQWEFRKKNFQFEAYTRAAQPTRFKIPDNISEIFYVKYDSKEVPYISPSDFQHISDGRDETKPEVVSFVYDGAPVRVLNNRAPTYWTSFDDEVIFFDSYDSSEDTGGWMVATKCFGYGLKDVCNWPDSSLADDFVPDLPEKFFPMLRAMSRERAFFYLKQMDTPSDTRFVRKQKIHLNKTEARVRRGTGVVPHTPDYGRRR